MDYLDHLFENNSITINKVFNEPISVICLFRKLTELSRLFLLRSLNINSQNQAIPIKLFKDKWGINNGHEIFFKEMNKYSICRITGNNDQLSMNPHFLSSLQQIQQKGITYKQVSIQNNQLSEEDLESIQKWSYQQWQNIHECIVCLYNKLGNRKMSNLVAVLKANRLVNSNNNQISKAGFEFILSSTARQINHLIYLYTQFMADKYSLENIVNLILELNLLPVNQVFTIPEDHNSAFISEIVNDFCSIGLINSLQNGQGFVTTRLLHNFSFEQLSLNIQFKFNLIIETNFKIYVYSINDFIVRLLENFCELEYKMPGFIVGEMKRANVMQLFSNDIRSDQLIEFLSQNIDMEKLKKISDKKQDNFNHLYNQTNKPELEYLQIYKRTNDNKGIPDNVCQQLHLWYSEINVNFSKKALEDEQINYEQELILDIDDENEMEEEENE